MAVEQYRSEVPAEEQEDQLSTTKERGITIRAIIIGFCAIIPGVFWGVYGDVISRTDLTSTSLMMPPVIILTALLLINAGIKKIVPAWALVRSELITIYAMLTVSVVLSGMGMLQFLCTTLGAVPYYQTPDNHWNNYLGYVPSWVMPKLGAIQGFYKGGQPVPWIAWQKPILVWSGFLFMMLFCMMCINTIVRKQWMDRERLIFPIVQLPLEMTDPKTSFFKNKVMWAGFFIAAGLETMNSLAFLYPSIPKVQLTSTDLAPYFTTPPWNSIGYFPVTFYPLAIGLGFVLSTDISFSCWFFYLLTKIENVFSASLGLQGAGGLSSPPYVSQQGAGAFIGITLVVIYLARQHLKDVILKVISRNHSVDDSNEPMSYSMAVTGLAVCFLILIAFCWRAGISPVVAAIYLGIYLVFSTTISRLRAEAGPAWVMGPYMDSLDVLVQPVGSGVFSRQNLVALAYFHWFSIEMRCCPMPQQIEAMKMGQATRLRQRALMFLLLGAIVAGIAVGFIACLSVWYSSGAASAKVEPWRTGMGKASFDRLTNYVQNPTKPDIPGVMAMIFGATFTFFLSFMRSRFIWFPFHPAGYVLANTGTMYWLWMPFLIAWLCKVIITKYAGIKGYRAALPFFLGLVFGDYIASGLWALAGSVMHMQMYRCFPC